MTEKCAVCNEVMSVESTIARSQAGRWVAWPPVLVKDGRTGHVECFIREGTVSIGDRTGPEFADELDRRDFVPDPQPFRPVAGFKPGVPKKSVFYLDVMKLGPLSKEPFEISFVEKTCTCDDPGDGPCPQHGAEMAAQDARIAEENAKGGFVRSGVARLLGGEPFRTPFFLDPEQSEKEKDARLRDDILNSFLSQCGHPRAYTLSREDRDVLVKKILDENRLRASVGKEFLTAGPPLVHEGFKAVLDEIEAERDWTPGDPSTPGIYAIVVCWDPCEGMFPNVSTWDGARWVRPPGPISFYRGPFATEAEAWAWAEAHDPEEVTRPKHMDNETTVTIPAAGTWSLRSPKPVVEALLKNQREVAEHLDRRPLGGHSDLFDGVFGTRWELAPDFQCLKCKGPLERTRGLMLMSPWAGAVRCTQCDYRDSVAGYLGKSMIKVEPMQPGAEEPMDHEVTVTIPQGTRADITIVHQPDGSVKADVQLDERFLVAPVHVIYEGPWAPDPKVERELTDLVTEGVMKDLAEAEPEILDAIHQGFAPTKGMISRGPIFEADTTKDPIVIRPLTQAAADIMDQAPIAPLPPGPDYSKLVDSDAFDRAFEDIVRNLGLPTEYLAAPGQEVFFVEYKVPALTGDKVHAQGPYLTKHIAQGHYTDIFNFEGVEQVEIVGRPNNVQPLGQPHPGQEMLDGAARGKIQDALRTIDRTARAIQKKQEGKTHGYVLPENLSAYRRLCDNLGIPWEEVTEKPKEP